MEDDALATANVLERIGRLSRTEEQFGDLYPAQWAALRYLARANRFSRTPMALTRYLGTTRGTMSQTIIALERKGFVVRIPSARDKRSVIVELTDVGKKQLRQDPIAHLAKTIDTSLGPDKKYARTFLEKILHTLIEANEGRPFGQCQNCRHFQSEGGSTKSEPHHCALLKVDLSKTDSQSICMEQDVV